MHQTKLTDQTRWNQLHAIALGVPVGSMLERRTGATVAPMARLETAAGNTPTGRSHTLRATWRLTASGDRLEMSWHLRAA